VGPVVPSAGLVVGVLAVLFVIGAVVVGGGWYYWSHRTPVKTADGLTPTPAPQDTVAPSNGTNGSASTATPAAATEVPAVASTEAPVTSSKPTRESAIKSVATLPPTTSRTTAPVKVADGGDGGDGGTVTTRPEKNGSGAYA